MFWVMLFWVCCYAFWRSGCGFLFCAFCVPNMFNFCACLGKLFLSPWACVHAWASFPYDRPSPVPRPFLWLSTNAVQLTVPIGDDGQLTFWASCGPPVLWHSTNAVQLTVPIGDDGQLMSWASCDPPVLWHSTNAVQLTVPIGDDGQLMSWASCGPPVIWLSTNAINFSVACGALFSILLFRSSDFSVSLRFLCSALQTFPFLVRSTCSLFRLFRSHVVPLCRSSDFSVPISLLFSVLLSTRQFLDGGVFRSIGNFVSCLAPPCVVVTITFFASRFMSRFASLSDYPHRFASYLVSRFTLNSPLFGVDAEVFLQMFNQCLKPRSETTHS